MLKVAVLDDYQNVTKKFGNWSELDGKINLKIFNKYFDDTNELVKHLSDFDVLCLMRERTPLPKELIDKCYLEADEFRDKLRNYDRNIFYQSKISKRLDL